MKSGYIALIVLAGFIFGGAVSVRAQDGKVGFVDLDKVFNDFYKTKLADAQLKDQADQFTSDRKQIVERLKKLREEFNATREAAQNTALSEEVRNQKRDEAEEKLVALREEESKLRQFDEQRRKQLDDQGRRMRNRIVQEIRSTISDYAREKGFSAVLDSSGESMNGVALVLYMDDAVDITGEILQILNKGHSTE